MEVTGYLKSVLRNAGTRILLAIFLSIVVIMAFVLTYGYYTQLGIYEEEELMKLEAIAKTLSLQIDGDAHAALFSRYQEMDALTSPDQDSMYHAIYRVLTAAKAKNGLTTEIYTMVLQEADTTVLFGVSTSNNLNYRHVYTDFPATLPERYPTGGTIPMYEDMYGSWLSAFAPVTNSQGKVVAVVQVDERFDDFIMAANHDIRRNIFISFIILGVIAFFLFQSISTILDIDTELRKDKENVERLRRELIANVSHDLRTPVAVIHGYVETMKLKQKEISQENRDKYIEIILQNTERLRKLINELFELAKLEAAGKELKPEPFQLAELVQDVSGKFKLLAEEQGIVLNTPTGGNLPMVMGDIAMIDRVLQNLIENSLKFCNDGDFINIEMKRQGSKVYISVSDSGPGIPTEDQPYVFERYHKGSNAKRDSSTGLGLAIVKKIIDMHNSEVVVRSSKTEGPSFTFYLPVA